MSHAHPLRVFLCHANADKYAVRQLYFYLVEFEIDAWLDTEKLSPGQDWEKEIPKAIKNSDAIIVCLSKDSVNKEGYVQKEIKFALDKADEMPEGRIFLIPARLDDYVSLPDDLKKIQRVNLFEEDGCVKLLESLQMRIQQVGASPIVNPTGRPMREKAKQLATMIVHETNIKKIRGKQNEPENEKTFPVREIKQNNKKAPAWNNGIFFGGSFVVIALALSWILLSKPMPTRPAEETSTPVAINTPTSISTLISATVETPVPSDVPTYASTPYQVPQTQVPPTRVLPTQILPTRLPPTQIPPTQVPPTEIPPTPTPYIPGVEGKIVFDSPADGGWQVFSISPDGSDLRQLTNISNGVGDPAISPNGQFIVFVGDASTKSLYSMRADGTQIHSIYQTSIEVGWPAWSFDSQKIVFAVQTNGYKNLYMMNADGTNVTRLTEVSANDLAPSFSPDGNQIAFSSDRSGSWEIYKLVVSTGQISKLTNLGDPDGQGWPSWSPDGSMIAFESRGNSDKRDIFTMYTDGTQVKNITDSPTYEGAPVWSPNGAKIAFASDRDGGLDIYIMRSNGEQIQRLTTIWAWGPSWSFAK
jgi:Tol biopolymer transport system component